MYLPFLILTMLNFPSIDVAIPETKELSRGDSNCTVAMGMPALFSSTTVPETEYFCAWMAEMETRTINSDKIIFFILGW